MFPFLSGVRLDMEMSGFLVAVLWITRCANFEKMLVLLALRLRGHYVKSSRSGWLMLLSPILFYDWTSSYIPGSSDTKYFCIVNISKRSIGRFNQCIWYSIEPLYFLFFFCLVDYASNWSCVNEIYLRFQSVGFIHISASMRVFELGHKTCYTDFVELKVALTLIWWVAYASLLVYASLFCIFSGDSDRTFTRFSPLRQTTTSEESYRGRCTIRPYHFK